MVQKKMGSEVRVEFWYARKVYVPLIPRSQPRMKELAIARTSLGRSGMSNDCGMTEELWKRLRMVWWRDSMVTMEAAAVRTRGSSMRCAAPRYAPTPTFSTTWATVNMVSTSTSTLEKSNVQVDNGVSPKPTIISWMAETWVDSSPWMTVISEIAISGEEKPALVKSDAWNFFSASE